MHDDGNARAAGAQDHQPLAGTEGLFLDPRKAAGIIGIGIEQAAMDLHRAAFPACR